jgi:hypothetical protein
MSQRSSCVFHNHVITTDRVSCALCTMRTPNNALYITVTNSTAAEFVIAFDGKVYLGNPVSQDMRCTIF